MFWTLSDRKLIFVNCTKVSAITGTTSFLLQQHYFSLQFYLQIGLIKLMREF